MDSPIRVLSITKSTGGLASYNLRFCKAIDREQFEVEILCLSDNRENYAKELRELGFTAYTLDMERYQINPLSDLRLTRQIRQLVNKGNYDVLIAHGSKAGFIARLVGRITNTSAIYCLASMSFVPRIHGKKAYVYRGLEYIASMAGGHIVTLSEATQKELHRLNLSDDAHTTVIYTGIDLEQFQPTLSREEACAALNLDPNRPICGWAARFAKQKDPLNFIKTIARVVEKVPEVQIFMAGEGDLKEESVALANSLNLQDHITFAQWQSNVPLMLSAFDVYVLSSRWEGLPLSLLEAMAMEKASVVTAVDGNVEVIENAKNGFLVDYGDNEMMAEYIIKLLTDTELRSRIGKAARQRVETAFSVEQMMHNWETLIRQQHEHH